MDLSAANETAGNRKSLVISRLELFEQINSNDRSTNRAVKKPVSRSNSNGSGIGGDCNSECRDRPIRPDVNCVNSDNDISDGGIDANADAAADAEVPVNANRSPVTERKPKELPDFSCLPISNDVSPCSKRISYNIAVSQGVFGKIASHKDKPQPKCDITIDESEGEEQTEIHPDRNVAGETIDESDSDENDVKVEKTDVLDANEDTGSNDSTSVASADNREDAKSADSPCVPVDDINIEDLNSTKLTNDILSLISSSRITDECKFETDVAEESPKNDATSVKSKDEDYPEELNPFGDEDEDVGREENTKISNPFDSDDDSETVSSRNKSSAKVSTNPFGSESEDEDEPSLDDVSVKKTPVPLPRSVKKPVISPTPQPSPKPRIENTTLDEFGSPNAIRIAPSPSPSRRSFQTPIDSRRKLSGGSLDVSFQRSPGNQSVNSTLRKKKPAPPPPSVVPKSPTPSNNNISSNGVQLTEQTNQTNDVPPTEQTVRSKTAISPWKNRKGPAPARPIPLRRPVKEMPLEDIKIELSDIEIRQQELERQGKQIEQMIHDQNTPNSENVEDASSNEELVLQLFELVNEKNELLRRHSELMYMRKMHNLEEEHADIEYQLRCLMLQPESNKTDCDKTKEEELLRRLVEVVEKRNEIIEAMEKDRLRETAEDESVTTQLDVNGCSKEEKSPGKKSKKKKDKLKERKEDGEKSHEKHSPGKVIKQKFMTLRHSTKKLNSKITH